MFERYTERARRVLFFARYEASQLGGLAIESDHLLLGLIREGEGLTARMFARARIPLEQLRREIEGRTVLREMVPTSVEIPFSGETKRILQHAAKEADGLHHGHIGPEHLLLGILCADRSVAASILTEHGMRLATVREDIVQPLHQQASPRSGTPGSPSIAADMRDAQFARIDRIIADVGALARRSGDFEAAQLIVDQLRALREWITGLE